MAIQRWDPRRDLLDLQDRVSRLFEEALSRSGGGVDGSAPVGAWKPPMDLFEEGHRYVLRADLPGVDASDVELHVEGGRLVLRGERRADAAVARESYLRVERPYGNFSAQVALPPSVDPAGIRATHRNGVIEIVLPKRKEAGASRIDVASD